MTSFAIDMRSDAADGVIGELQTAPERLVFLLAEPDTWPHLRVVDRIALSDDHIDDTGWHVQLTDMGRQHILQRATGTTAWLLEAHSHGRLGDPAHFSRTDRTGLRAWVDHLQWRLPGRGYGALVIGHDTIDGLVWVPESAAPHAVSLVHIAGETAWRTTRMSVTDWHRNGEHERA